ncbi:hypothetical protein E3N88_23932 [Mikania micrantha]|uniref:Uncharacterized protein n=1 Tax=Mikania micrantha TaxID=192012 RepID=A0A5N6NEN1_9ASTR|nr:hypothetical protein E3N88_23932 [Mikania micrantha]
MSKFAHRYLAKSLHNDPTSSVKLEKDDFPTTDLFDYGPFDDEWILNYKFDGEVVPDRLPSKDESPNKRTIHVQNTTDASPTRDD